MKKLLLPLLILLLLCGCGKDPTGTTAQTAATTEPTPIAYLRDTNSTIEELTESAVEAYSLENRSVTGIRFFGNQLLAFTTADHVELTTVLVLGGQDLGIMKSIVMDCGLSPEHLTLSSDGKTYAYYHDMENTLVLMDAEFTELRRIQLPDQVTDRPLLSKDLSTAYYASGNRIYALDLESGLSRLLKEHNCLTQRLTALHFSDTVMEVLLTLENGQTQVAFISAENGETTGIDKGLLTLFTGQKEFLLRRMDGTVTETLVGRVDGQLQAIDIPTATVYPAFSAGGIVGITGSTATLYNLDSGRIYSQISLGEDVLILEADADPNGDCIWLRVLDQQTEKPLLLRWKLDATKSADTTQYIHKRYTAQDPDTEGLAACQKRADQIGAELGLSILIGGDLPAAEGTEYVTEYQVSVLNSTLDELEAIIKKLPKEFYLGLGTVNQSGVVHIGLVRHILDVAGQPSDDMGGVHLVSGGDHYIILSLQPDTEAALIHQLSHVLDAYVFAHTGDYDLWEDLNPKAFAYTRNYDVNPDPDEPTLQGDTQCFVSPYGMSFPMEDRATLFVAAMEADNEALFTLPRMQAKLQYMCKAIRNAYNWEDTELSLPWEQYLEKK